MLLQARCHCISGVGVCGRMWRDLPTVYAAVYDKSYCEVMCCTCKVLQSFIGCGYGWCGMICRELWCVCGWKNVKRYRDGSQ